MTNRYRPSIALVLIGCVGAGAAHGQSQTSEVVQPSSPPPQVASAAAPTASNPAPANITQIVYTPQLPGAAEITNAAAAQGMTVDRIVQTAHQVVAFYRHANGQTSTVAYQSLPPTGATTAPVAAAPQVVVTSPAPAVAPQVVVTAPPPTVVYQTAPRVMYYDYPTYYYPRTYYPPVSFSFGLGYNRGFYHGGHGRHHYRHR